MQYPLWNILGQRCIIKELDHQGNASISRHGDDHHHFPLDKGKGIPKLCTHLPSPPLWSSLLVARETLHGVTLKSEVPVEREQFGKGPLCCQQRVSVAVFTRSAHSDMENWPLLTSSTGLFKSQSSRTDNCWFSSPPNLGVRCDDSHANQME